MRLRSIVFLVTPLLLLAVAFGACGGGGSSLTLGQYFKQMESISQDAKKSSDDLSTQFDKDIAGADTEEKQLQVFRDYLSASETRFKTALDKVKAIDPPGDAGNAHKDFVAAGDALLGVFNDFIGRAAAVKSGTELQNLVSELDKPPFKDAGDRVDNACSVLQGIADKNNIKVDLACNQGAGGGTPSPGAASADMADYFNKIQAIFDDTNTALKASSSDLDSAVAAATTDAEQVNAFRDSFTRSHKAVDDAISQLESITPPSAASSAHNTFLQAARDMRDLSQQVLDNLANLKTTDDINTYFQKIDLDLTAASDRGDKACVALQDLADANNISVNLNCGN